MILKSIFLLLISLALFFASILLRDPVLAKFRYSGLIVINLIGILWIYFYLIHRSKKEILKTITLLFVLAGMGISLGKETNFQYKKNFVRSYDKVKLATLAKHILVGFRSQIELNELIELPVIGFFITHHNVKGLSLEETKHLIDEIQTKRLQNGFSQALIATDQEGGKVSRLSPPLKLQPSLGELLETNANLDKESLREKINEYAKEQTRELKSIGVNINFSPILDLKVEKEPSHFDFYSRIYNRAISKDPAITSFVAEVYSKKLLEGKIIPTLKHFPGIGRITEDTHFFNAELNTPLSELEMSDLIPFTHLTHNLDLSLVMLSHSTITHLDSNHPISISEKGIQEYIRSKFPITTILITDDMNMGPMIYFKGGIGNAAVTGINAGLDILLVSYDGQQIYEVLYSLIESNEKGNLDQKRLEESNKRLNRLTKFLFEKD
ncbi:MAG: glycoside hydrolase family 3 protein [Leptospiraceae bacterium]|nr:glycoside hydrolase family 3 protein [Leptospiraceae bacterium]